MTGSKVIVVVEPDRRCLNIPKYNVTNNLKPPRNQYLSEYRAVYRPWPAQKQRKCIRPQVQKIHLASSPMASDTIYKTDFAEPLLTEKGRREKKKKAKKELSEQYKIIQEEVRNGKNNFAKTTYTSDFCPKETPLRRPYRSAVQQTYQLPKGAFNGKSVYMESYVNYQPEVARSCRQTPIRPPDALQSNANCLKKDNNCTEPSPCQSEGSNTCVIPMQVTTAKPEPEYKSNNIDSKPSIITQDTKMKPESESRPINSETVKQGEEKKASETVIAKSQETPRSNSEPLQTTFMADYKPYWDVRKPSLCRPEENNYREAAQFDGITTTMAVYKAWTPTKPEMPPWAKKAVYKQPTEGMQLNSTYSMDYADSKVIPMVAAMIKPAKNENVLIQQGSKPFNGVTTYNQNYTEWKNMEPSKSYQVRTVYNPPREKMLCKSMYMTCYKGEAGKKSTIIRHASEHRQLNKDGKCDFSTTYREIYQDQRPKSSHVPVASPAMKPVKNAWEDLSSTKELNNSCDSGIDMMGFEREDSL